MTTSLAAAIPADLDALEALLAEYGMSTEEGGANEGNEQAEAHYQRASALIGALRSRQEIFIIITCRSSEVLSAAQEAFTDRAAAGAEARKQWGKSDDGSGDGPQWEILQIQ